MKKYTIALLLNTIGLVCLGGHNYDWEAGVKHDSKDGFHQILLSPDITRRLNISYSDIRLYDREKHEIPYLFRKENPSYSPNMYISYELTEKRLFNEYKIVKKEHIQKCCTHLVLSNPSGNTISNISILIRNSDVRKKVKLLGSDDRANWYVIKDNYLFHSVYNNKKTAEIKLINFPLSNYNYYKIEIDDSSSAPLNILKVGYYDSQQIIFNRDSISANNLSLNINTSALKMKTRFSGSNDLENWKVIKDECKFNVKSKGEQTSDVTISNFPFVCFKYYKLEMIGNSDTALNIFNIGFYDTWSEELKYTAVSVAGISQKDSTGMPHQSFMKISFAYPQYIDKLELNFEGPQYYLRKGRVCIMKTVKRKNRKQKSYFETLQQFEFSSTGDNIIYLYGERVKDIYIIIDNEDNTPLKLNSVKAYQLKSYLTAYLDHDVQYYLRFGDVKANTPTYDLKYFEDSIPEQMPIIHTAGVASIAEMTGADEKDLPKIFIWIAIGGIVLFLGFMSVRMIGEMNKQ